MPFELKAADILLYRSDSVVSRAIRFVDDTEVSHAGLYLGDGTVGEALTNGGLQRQPLQRSITDSQWVAVRRLAKTPPVMQRPRCSMKLPKIFLSIAPRWRSAAGIIIGKAWSSRNRPCSTPVRKVPATALNQIRPRFGLARRVNSVKLVKAFMFSIR